MKLLTNVITNTINLIKSIKYTNNIDIDPSNDLIMNTDNVASFICIKTGIPIEIVLEILGVEDDWLHENGFMMKTKINKLICIQYG